MTRKENVWSKNSKMYGNILCYKFSYSLLENWKGFYFVMHLNNFVQVYCIFYWQCKVICWWGACLFSSLPQARKGMGCQLLVKSVFSLSAIKNKSLICCSIIILPVFFKWFVFNLPGCQFILILCYHFAVIIYQLFSIYPLSSVILNDVIVIWHSPNLP